MDNVGEFIIALAAKQRPEFKDIAINAYDRWVGTGTISEKMARWIRRSAKINGMKMPIELQELIAELIDDSEVRREIEPASSLSRRTDQGADQADGEQRMPWNPAACRHCEAQIVLFQELSTAFAKAAERLAKIM